MSITAAAMSSSALGAQQRVVATHVSTDERHAFEAIMAHRVSIDLTRVPFERALDSVSHVAKVLVQYEAPSLKAYGLVTLHATDAPLGDVFERMLSGTTLVVAPDGQGNLIVESRAMGDSVPTLGTISGRVIDSATGRALDGATVRLIGTKRTTVVQDSGRFTLRDVPIGEQQISIRLFGYRPADYSVTVTAGARATVRAALVSVPNILSGVVTTAAGVQDKRSIGADITTINADSVLKIAPVKTVTDLLETRVPGLTVQRTSGVPGSPSRIRLRGIGGGLVTGANTSNDPILIVDGIRVNAQTSTPRAQNLAPGSAQYLPPSPLDQIDPNTIETIEVFKGPSATAQWGSDAGNGVIVITTKRGRAGPTRTDVVFNAGLTQMPGSYAKPGYYPFSSADEGAVTSRLCSVFPENLGTDPFCGYETIDSVVRYQALDDSNLRPFGLGTSNDVSATVSGGTPAVTYSVQGAVQSQLGYLRLPRYFANTYMDAYGVQPPGWMRRPDRHSRWDDQVSVSIQPRPGFTGRITTALTHTDMSQGSGQSVLASLSTFFLDTAARDTTDYTRKVMVSPFVQRARNQLVTSTTNVQVTKALGRLYLDGIGGVSTEDREDRTLISGGIRRSQAVPDTTGTFSLGRGHAETRTLAVRGNTSTTQRVSLAFGFDFVEKSNEDVAGTRDTLSRGVETPTMLSTVTVGSAATKTAGWWLEPKLNMESRFFVMPGFRLDGGSASTQQGTGAGGVLSLFPHLNYSWIAVDRSGGVPFGGILTLLRLRTSFGVAGVQPDPSWNLRLLTNTYKQGKDPTDPIDALFLQTIGNTRLHPERSREIEGGFDADLWGGRVGLTVTPYYKLRIDAIQDIGVAQSVYGGMSYYVNIGKIKNTGLNMDLLLRPIETSFAMWSVTANFTSNTNQVVSLNDDVPYIPTADGHGRLMPGYPLDGRWERPILGYHDTDDDGRLGFGEVSVGDSSVYLGSGQPQYEIPFSSTLSLWRGVIGVNVAFDYQHGFSQVNIGGLSLLKNTFFNTHATLNQQAAAITAFCQTSKDNIFGLAGNCDDEASFYGVTQTVNVLRLQSASISYEVPLWYARRLRASRMNVALQGDNLALWTNYRGKDPNVNMTTLGEQVSDPGVIPRPRLWSLRVSLGY